MQHTHAHTHAHTAASALGRAGVGGSGHRAESTKDTFAIYVRVGGLPGHKIQL